VLSSTIVVENVTLLSCGFTGIYADTSEVHISNTTINDTGSLTSEGIFGAGVTAVYGTSIRLFQNKITYSQYNGVTALFSTLSASNNEIKYVSWGIMVEGIPPFMDNNTINFTYFGQIAVKSSLMLRVLWTDNKSIAEANVLILDDNNTQVYNAQTNASGYVTVALLDYYVLDNGSIVKNNSYNIIVDKNGITNETFIHHEGLTSLTIFLPKPSEEGSLTHLILILLLVIILIILLLFGLRLSHSLKDRDKKDRKSR
jgi:hypothetical protein